jgi:hypothetical protein
VIARKIVSVVAVLAITCAGAEGQDFRKVEEILGRLDSTLKPVRGQVLPQEVQKQLDSSAQAGLPLADRIAALERKVQSLRQPTMAVEDAASLATTIAELRRAVEALKVPAPAAKFPALKVGLLGQFHAMTAQDLTTAAQDQDGATKQHWQRQLYMRRMRVLVGGSLSAQTTFFFESDAVNIGKVAANGTKTNGVAMYVQDAQVQHVFAPELALVAGLQLVGIARNGLQSAAALMALNYGSFQFVPTGPLDNSVGRDLGVNFRGFLADERLEYRAGVFSGRNFNLFSPLRGTVRLQYNFMDREKGFYYNGTNLGTTRHVAVGSGLDIQGSYRAFALDGFVELPVDETLWMTVSGSVSFLNGGGSDTDSTYFTGTVPRQTVVFLESGLLLKSLGLQPYVKYEKQSVNATLLRQVGATSATLDLQNALRSNDRFGIGVNYFVTGHQASVKVVYEFVGRNRLTLDKSTYEHVTTGECTLQLQFFLY